MLDMRHAPRLNVCSHGGLKAPASAHPQLAFPLLLYATFGHRHVTHVPVPDFLFKQFHWVLRGPQSKY